MKLFSDVDDKGGKVDGVISAVIGAFAKMPKLASDKGHDFGSQDRDRITARIIPANKI